MSSRDPNSATETVVPFVPEPLVASASDSVLSPAKNIRDEIDQHALTSLREFFLLLDEWEKQPEPQKEAAT